MTNFSTPELTATVKTTLEAVVTALAELDISAEVYDGSYRMSLSLKGYYQNMFYVEEETPCYGRPNGRVKYSFGTLYLSTGNMSAKTFKGETKDLVSKLIASIKERHEGILEANKHDAAVQASSERIRANRESLKETFSEFARNISSEHGLTLKFDHLKLEKATEILQALKDAGITF